MVSSLKAFAISVRHVQRFLFFHVFDLITESLRDREESLQISKLVASFYLARIFFQLILCKYLYYQNIRNRMQICSPRFAQHGISETRTRESNGIGYSTYPA